MKKNTLRLGEWSILLGVLLVLSLHLAYGTVSVSPDPLQIDVKEDQIADTILRVTNEGPGGEQFTVSVEGDAATLLDLTETGFFIGKGESYGLPIRILGNNATGTYEGTLVLKGSEEKSVDVVVRIRKRGFRPVNALLLEIVEPTNRIFRGRSMQYGISFNKLLNDVPLNVTYRSVLELRKAGNRTNITLQKGTVEVDHSFTRLFEAKLPGDIPLGTTTLKVYASYLDYETSVSSTILIEETFLNRRIFNVPLWRYIAGMLGLAATAWGIILYRRHKEAKKRFHAKTDLKSLPHPGPR
ncbi:MAG: hypothetical protein GXP63_05965, partial [DPANN group archaeon]|nr:hypothetical protein [DPANN group archaeon]